MTNKVFLSFDTLLIIAAITFATIVVGGVLFGRWILLAWTTRRILRRSNFLRKNVQMLETVVQNTRDGILIHDIYGRIEWANEAFLRMSGREMSELIGRRPQQVMLPEADQPSDAELESYVFDISQENLNAYEVVRNVRKNGEAFWCSLSFGVVEARSELDTKIVVVTRDVTDQINREADLKESNRRAEFQAGHDVLTGLPNRAKFTADLAEVHDQFKATGAKYGVLHIDLDKFKEVNDTLGHAAGDAVLVATADRMKLIMRTGDSISRFGGDEFIVICRDVSGFDDMRKVAARIIETLSQPIDWHSKRLEIGASIGIALVSDAVADAESLVRNADMALYEVKNSGRNNYACYDDQLGRAHMIEQRMTAELNLAIERGEFRVVFQPQYSLIAKAVTGFEGLLRWDHPARGELAPAEFMDIAIRNGLMSRLDRISLTASLKAIKKIHHAGAVGLKVSINASATSLTDDDYLSYLKWQTELLDIDPNEVIIEVLETTFFSKADERAENMIQKISEAGFRLELDDFGTGFAGLSHLANLKIDGVKIDRSMIHDLEKSTTSQIIVEATVGLGRDLGLHVIAEGVENAEQAELLREFGCANIQGFGIAPPMHTNDVVDWLANTDMRGLLKKMPTQPGAETLKLDQAG